MNTSALPETGTLEIIDNDGIPFTVSPVGNAAGSSFAYSIQPNGVFHFQTNGFPNVGKAGWARAIPDPGNSTPIVALTMRSLYNERNDFLMTTFPIADANQPAPSPIVFPQIADGGGYVTQFILLSAGGSSAETFNFYGEDGTPLAIGK
jgi:hypothetical protein